jgi:N-formylglutamate deformylase
MLEINRSLYLKSSHREAYRLGNGPIKTENFETLRNDIWAVMLLLAQEARCRAEVVYEPHIIPALGNRGVQR